MNTTSSIGSAVRGSMNGSSAMNGASESATSAEGEMAVIGAGVTIRGNVEAEVDLQIEGVIEGDVRCDTVILAPRGVVAGSIIADRVRVAGRVEGGIEATDLAVEAGAHIRGEVSYSRLRISNGGIFEGTMVHRPLPADAEEAARPRNGSANGNGNGQSKPQRVHYID